MTTKELIRAEIERRKNKWLAASRLVKKGKDTAMYAAGKSSAYTELLSFLDTLPDDELVSNDLAKAAEHYAWMKEQPLSDGERLSICFNPRIEAYKAGAKWQRKQDVLLSKITKEHLEGLRWIIRTGITTQPRPYHKYCKDLLQLLESYKNEI